MLFRYYFSKYFHYLRNLCNNEENKLINSRLLINNKLISYANFFPFSILDQNYS